MLKQIVKGEHSRPIEGLLELFAKGEITEYDIQFTIPLPSVLRKQFKNRVNELDEYITIREASEKWKIGESTLRVAFNKKDKRFNEDEYRKSGNVWLVKQSVLYRNYGLPKV